MDHIFSKDYKKFYDVAKEIMNKKESTVDEAVGVTNADRKKALKAMKERTKDGAAVSAHDDKLDANRYKKEARKSTQKAVTSRGHAKELSRAYSKSYNDTAIEKSNSYSLKKNAAKVVHKEEVEIDEAIGVTNAERKQFIKNYKKHGGVSTSDEEVSDHGAGAHYSAKRAAELKKSNKIAAKKDKETIAKHPHKDGANPAYNEYNSKVRAGVEHSRKNREKSLTLNRQDTKTYNDNVSNFSKHTSLAKAAHKSKLLNKEELEVGSVWMDEEFGEGMIVSVTEDTMEVIFEHGVEVFELEEDYHPEVEFHVADKDSGHVKGKYNTIKRARNAKDKHDNAHGSYQHTIKYYHKDKKQYVDFKDTGPDSK
jgi:hypothetical protein